MKKSPEIFGPEKTLMMGWNENSEKIIVELDSYVNAGSELLILAEKDLDLVELSTQNLTLTKRTGKLSNRKVLGSVHPEQFDNIILMSDKSLEVQHSDAQTLICLLHLRSIGALHKKDLSIVSEMRDIRNREVGIVAKADDFIIGDNITSLILAQIAENKELFKVFNSLFDSAGSEIYLKPIKNYWNAGEVVTFYDMVSRAFEYNETAIGYRLMANQDNASLNFGIKLNPRKDEVIGFNEGDYLIVLAEN